MAMVENKLLRRERTHAVAKQDVRFARMLLLRDDSKRNHIFDELIETAGSEVAKTSGRLCGQAVTAVIVSVNDKFRLRQGLSQFCIPADVLTKSVGDLNDSTNIARIAPFYAGNGKAIAAFKFQSLRCTHYIMCLRQRPVPG